MKQKIGTALDSKVVVFLKRQSRSTGKPLNQLIEEAVLFKGQSPALNSDSRDLRLNALKGFIGAGPKLPRKVVEDILAEDPFDQ